MDADTKLIISWRVDDRSAGAASDLIDDLVSRLASRIQLTTDGHSAYLDAVDRAVGAEVDYAMLVKLYGQSSEGEKRYSPAVCTGAKKTRIQGKPDPFHVSTSYVERRTTTSPGPTRA